jgi:hypothetical protein
MIVVLIYLSISKLRKNVGPISSVAILCPCSLSCHSCHKFRFFTSLGMNCTKTDAAKVVNKVGWHRNSHSLKRLRGGEWEGEGPYRSYDLYAVK